MIFFLSERVCAKIRAVRDLREKKKKKAAPALAETRSPCKKKAKAIKGAASLALWAQLSVTLWEVKPLTTA